MAHRWATLYFNEKLYRKALSFAFSLGGRLNIMCHLFCFQYFIWALYSIAWYFLLKQSRQKKHFTIRIEGFYFFLLLPDSLLLIVVAWFFRSSQHSVFGDRARIREKKLEISFSYLANTTYNMKKNEKVTWVIIQLVGKNDSLCGEENEKVIKCNY